MLLFFCTLQLFKLAWFNVSCLYLNTKMWATPCKPVVSEQSTVSPFQDGHKIKSTLQF